MGTGYHGVNGISPVYSISIYMTYVFPRLMYGLEAITLKDKHIKLLEQYHRNTLKELHTLPRRTASCAIYLLCGTPTLEALLDVQISSLLTRVSRHTDSPLVQIGRFQLATKNTRTNSWFLYAAKRLSRYKIDIISVLDGLTRYNDIKSTIMDYWTSQLREDAYLKSTLCYLDATACNLQKPHSIWSTSGTKPAETRKAIQKARLLTGTYLLQSNKAAFNQHRIDSTCPLCGLEQEDRQHMILKCPSLSTVRDKYMSRVTHLIPDFEHYDCDQKLKILLDSYLDSSIKCDRADLEVVSRSLCYSLHCKRTHIINGS